MRAAVVPALVASLAMTVSALEEKVKLTSLRIHKQGSGAETSISDVELHLETAKGEKVKCFANEVSFPKPKEFYSCENIDYQFLPLASENEAADFYLMLYHDVRAR